MKKSFQILVFTPRPNRLIAGVSSCSSGAGMCHLTSTRSAPPTGYTFITAVVGFDTPRTVRVPTALPRSVSTCLVMSTRLSSVKRISGYRDASKIWCIVASRICTPVISASDRTVTSP